VFVIFSCFSINVFAVNNHTCEICGQVHDLDQLGGMQESAYNLSEKVYSKKTFEKNGLSNYMKFDITGSTDPNDKSNFKPTAALWESAKNFYQILLPFGSVLCVIYISIELFENMNKDTLSPENLSKHIMKMFFGLIMLNVGFDLITAFISVSNTAFDLLENSLSSVKNNYQTTGATAGLCNYSEMLDSDFFGALGVYFHLVVPYIAMEVARVACFLVIWARILEVIVRTIFAPLGLADLLAGGRSSNGFKYLKRLFAALMVGVILNAILTGYTFIMAALGSGSFIIVLVITYTMITTILKSSGLAKDMIGV
jgi:hypothetical protein